MPGTILSDVQKCVYAQIADTALNDPETSNVLARCLGLLLKRPSDETVEVDLRAVRALGFDGMPAQCPELRAVRS